VNIIEAAMDDALQEHLRLLERLYRLYVGSEPHPEVLTGLEDCMYSVAHCLDLLRRLARERGGTGAP
jgi:hypothetical protein